MIYRIAGGIFITLLGLSMFGTHLIPDQFIAIFGVVAGIALLLGY